MHVMNTHTPEGYIKPWCPGNGTSIKREPVVRITENLSPKRTASAWREERCVSAVDERSSLADRLLPTAAVDPYLPVPKESMV